MRIDTSLRNICGQIGGASAQRRTAVRIVRRSRSLGLLKAAMYPRLGDAVAVDEQVLNNSERLTEMTGWEALVAARQMALEAFQPLAGDRNDIAGRRRAGRNRRVAAVRWDGRSRDADVRFHTTVSPFSY